MASVALRNIIALVAAGAGLALATPAAAQFYSEGYEFLEAVKDREGTEATEMLNTPGSTVINSRDISNGETGLHIVVSRRDIVWTRWLLQEGANPNIADNRGRTPLIAATEIGFLEGVEALLRRGAQVDVANATGTTPLMSAVLTRNVELMEILLEGGADPDRTDNTGRSARDYAQERGVPPRILAAIEASERDESEGGGRSYGPVF
ncbi:MAG: ankyrin repeat domain-containing protein [Erythrobacter sp.]|nr:MAG: ankyrin repeat domain-containing protein [Erythrobacter sp.]